jgi:hypothetical protein
MTKEESELAVKGLEEIANEMVQANFKLQKE